MSVRLSLLSFCKTKMRCCHRQQIHEKIITVRSTNMWRDVLAVQNLLDAPTLRTRDHVEEGAFNHVRTGQSSACENPYMLLSLDPKGVGLR